MTSLPVWFKEGCFAVTHFFAGPILALHFHAANSRASNLCEVFFYTQWKKSGEMDGRRRAASDHYLDLSLRVKYEIPLAPSAFPQCQRRIEKDFGVILKKRQKRLWWLPIH